MGSWLWSQGILAKEKLRGYQIIQLIWVWVASKPFGEVLNFGSSDFNQFRYVSELWLALTLSELWLALTLSELWLANKSKTILDPTNNWFEFPRSHFWFANRIDNGRIWKIKYVCIQSTDWGNNSWWFTGNYVRRDGIRETRARWTVGRSGRARSIYWSWKAKNSGIDHFILDNLQFLLSPIDDPFQSQNDVVRFLRNESEFFKKDTVMTSKYKVLLTWNIPYIIYGLFPHLTYVSRKDRIFWGRVTLPWPYALHIFSLWIIKQTICVRAWRPCYFSVSSA